MKLIKKYTLVAASVLAISPAIASAGGAFSLPDEVEQSLQRAYQTRDPFVIGVVRQAIIDDNPAFAARVDSYLDSLQVAESGGSNNFSSATSQNTEAVSTLSPSAGTQATEEFEAVYEDEIYRVTVPAGTYSSGDTGTVTINNTEGGTFPPSTSAATTAQPQEPQTYAEKATAALKNVGSAIVGVVESGAEKLSNLAPAAGSTAGDESPWSGNVEGGLDFATGNTDREDGSISARLEYEYEKWQNILKGSARGSKENDTRTEEEYRVNDQLRYNFTDYDYGFGELDYVNDRFSGYQYRISELIGYGHHFIKEDHLKVTGEVAVGSRQSKLTDGSDEETLLGKVGADVEWDINDRLTFTEEASSEFGGDAVITRSITALKADMTDTLYLKLSFEFEHIDDAPPGRKHTDTLTSIRLGYEF